MSFKRPGHTGCHKNKKVCLVLRDGSRLYGRFLGQTDRWVDLDTGRVARTSLKSFVILRNTGGLRQP